MECTSINLLRMVSLAIIICISNNYHCKKPAGQLHDPVLPIENKYKVSGTHITAVPTMAP